MSNIPTSFNRETTGEEVASQYASNIQGKTVLITGTTWGSLAAETSRIIALHQPALLILAGRKELDLERTKAEILKNSPKTNIKIVARLDLADLEATRKAAEEIKSFQEKIDVIISSAGVMAVPYARIGPKSIERTFATNHVGPFLFTNLLLANLSPNSSPRIVVVSSDAHHHNGYGINVKDVGQTNKTGEYDMWDAYSQSKAANVLFASALRKRRYEAATLEPGTIWTSIADHLSLEDQAKTADGKMNNKSFFWKTLSQGAATLLTASFAPSSALFSGDDRFNAPYILHNQVDKAADFVRDDAEQVERLWRLSEELVGEIF